MKKLILVMALFVTGSLSHAAENASQVIRAVRVINNPDQSITLIQPFVKINTSAYVGFEMSCSLWANGCIYSSNDYEDNQFTLANATCEALGRKQAVSYSYSESKDPKSTYAHINKGGYLDGIYLKSEDAKPTKWKFIGKDYDYRGWEQFYSIYYLKSVTCR